MVKIKYRRRPPPTRGILWHRRFDKFQGSGFTPSESAWAADNRLMLSNDLVKLLIKSRLLFVKDHMKAFGSTKDQAIQAASQLLKDRNRRYGLTGADESNIFREISP